MRFFLDENFPPLVAGALRAVYGLEHEFASAFDRPERYVSIDDPDLIPRIGSDGFHTLLTFDRRQMVNATERKAVYDAGLHWVGLRMSAPPGPAGIAWLSSTVLSAMPHMLSHRPTAPHVYRLKGVPNQSGQVMDPMPVWNAALTRVYGSP